MESPYRFDEHYREESTLRDGTAVVFRLLRPQDKALLARGFARLSPESRYRRFLATRNELTDADLRYLTEIDGVNHFAVGALWERAAGEPVEGAGIARFVRLPEDPAVAEPAITVLDEFQGRGLGRALLSRLVAAARERGVERFRATVFADNAPMRALLRDLAPDAVEHTDGSEVTVEIALPPPDAPEGQNDGPLERLLAFAARHAHALRVGLQEALTRTVEGEAKTDPAAQGKPAPRED